MCIFDLFSWIIVWCSREGADLWALELVGDVQERTLVRWTWGCKGLVEVHAAHWFDCLVLQGVVIAGLHTLVSWDANMCSESCTVAGHVKPGIEWWTRPKGGDRVVESCWSLGLVRFVGHVWRRLQSCGSMVEYRHVLVLTLLPYVPDLASWELVPSLLWSLLLVNCLTLFQNPINQANDLLTIDF